MNALLIGLAAAGLFYWEWCKASFSKSERLSNAMRRVIRQRDAEITIRHGLGVLDACSYYLQHLPPLNELTKRYNQREVFLCSLILCY
ncbi:hypothetical protein SAMN05661091_4162 [Paenibacillus uliginis N3/975]|uniref:Uncharacterized protein n=1 Tax=Paenibacillus uliginis N3/975 TaxID=1313296 RepID=A0A1X7HK65_9BACL|nr:hypothetical protein SAMN05661091_4162 [Paenibacillus uliginis N3/975]